MGRIWFVTIDTNSYEPAYIQLAGIIRAWIGSGELPPGGGADSVVAGATRHVQRVHAEGDWLRALELLAEAEATGRILFV